MCSFMVTTACVVISLKIVFLDAKPFEINDPDNQYQYSSTRYGLGGYTFSYEDMLELAYRMEMGNIIKSKSGEDVLLVKGEYSTTFAISDCQVLHVEYTAGEDGFRAKFTYEEKFMEHKLDDKSVKISLCASRYKSASEEQNIGSDAVRTLSGGGLFG